MRNLKPYKGFSDSRRFPDVGEYVSQVVQMARIGKVSIMIKIKFSRLFK